jgi:hypothetical protein
MLFTNIDNETKMEILQSHIFIYEKDLYENLIKLAIDPESFDIDSFNKEELSIAEDDLAAMQQVRILQRAIDALTMINREISSLS